MRPRRRWRVGALLALLPFVVAFKGCWVVPSGLAPFDYIVAGNTQWVAVGLNDRIQLLPMPGNGAPSQSLSWSGALTCGWYGHGEPQVLVDRAGRWWFANLVRPTYDSTDYASCLAVTTGTDPRGPYLSTLLPGMADGQWLTVTSDKVSLTGINADGAVRTWVLNRADLLAGVAPHLTAITHANLWQHPVHNVSVLHPAPLYLYGPSPAVANAVRLTMVRGVPGVGAGIVYGFADAPVGQDLSEAALVTNTPDGPVGFPAQTPGVYTGQHLWFAHVDASATIHLVELDAVNEPPTPFAPVLVQHMTIPPPAGGAQGCPTLVVTPYDAAGPQETVAVSYAAASPTLHLSAYTRIRHGTDPANTLGAAGVFALGAPVWNYPWPEAKRLDYCAGSLVAESPGAPVRTALTVQPFTRWGDPNSVWVNAFEP